MKFRVVLIIVSTLANGLLAVVWWRGRPGEPPPRPAPVPLAAKPATPAGLALTSAAWTALNASDDAAFVARLREQGFPPEVVSALAQERIRRRFAAKLRELSAHAAVPYWRRAPWGDAGLDPETRAARRDLQRQMAAELRALVGDDADRVSPYLRALYQQQYGNLPPAKVAQVKAIETDYSELMAQVRDRAKGVVLPEDRELLSYLDQQRRADLAKVLTPDELAELDVRSSPSANEIRSRLRFFEPTEQEFRALTQLQLAFDAKYGRDNGSAIAQAQRQAALPDLKAQIAQALGPERYARYEVTTDGSFGGVAELTKLLQIPAESAYAVVQTKIEAARAMDAVRQDASLSSEERQARLTALEDAARGKLTTVLGAEGVKRYTERYGSYWMPSLQAGGAAKH